MLVPHTGQFGADPHPFASTNSKVRRIVSRILDLIEILLAIFSRFARLQPANVDATNGPPSKTLLEPELKAVQQNKEILRLLARDTGILQPIHVKVGLVFDPIVEIPVQAKSEFISVAVKRRNKPWSYGVGYGNARFLRLYTVVSERKLPGSPSVSSGCSFEAHEWALHFRSAVFWPGFAG